ncbi:retrotransposon gag protein [Cucumis melo var. makuwa]|uniref:Retrotransposon gag protein n=1 Tax=Cucumis melo var. makuwa TaxID=1194695 RepID=A0A5A7UI09_CUCMM|nr:retrotransposon gag protein [Cucumis melo var. makuwa]
MATNKAASKSSVASDSYIRLVTQSHLKRSMQEQEQGFVLKKKSLEQLIESPKCGIIIRDNPLFNNSTPASNLSDKESHLEVVSVMMENQPQQQSVSVASLSVQQLQDMIANSIRAQYRGPPQTSFMYSKPYTKRIDNLRMPLGYQPPKFQQFDGKGNPKQHIAHFVETCENAGSRGDQLVRQFVRSLKGNVFEWYTDLDPEGIKPRTFEELATRAHDMELSIANRGAKDFLVQRTRSGKNEINDTKKIANNVLNESMLVQETPLKSFSKRKEIKHERNHDGNEKRRPTLRERQKKVYLFPDSDVADMLEQLIKKQLIQLLECKRPEQAGKVDDPNYCKYHWVISHSVEKCFVLKELILKLARENKIELDIDEVAQTNHVAVNMTSSVSTSTLIYDQKESLIQFGTFEPILVRLQQKIMTSNSQNKEEPIEDEGEEWIVVAHKKDRQTSSVQMKSHFHKKYSKGNISHKKKGRRNKKMWKPKPIKGKEEDFLQPRRSITLAEFLSRSFLEDHSEEVLEVTACHTTSIVEVDNNYDSYEEVDNSNEIKQRTSVFDRIKPLTTRSSVFQRLSMATKEEKNQCPTSTYARTSAFKRLSISTSKKHRPSTSTFDRLKMTNDQQQREMKSLKAKPFHEENDDDKIHNRVPSRMKRKLSVDINTEGSLTVKPRFIIFTNPINEGDEKFFDENKSC